MPDTLPIKQVYGILFSKDGRILLRSGVGEEGTKFSLPGGKPEKDEKDISDTLRRETIEEVNTTIENPLFLGYQEIDEENGKPIYAQVRMVAIIDAIGESKPDPDRGVTYKRLLVSPARAIELLNWGEVGKQQIEEAFKIAKSKLGITPNNNKEEYI